MYLQRLDHWLAVVWTVEYCRLVQVEGKGNGIKTVIANMSEIAKALSRPPTCMSYFLVLQRHLFDSKFMIKLGESNIRSSFILSTRCIHLQGLGQRQTDKQLWACDPVFIYLIICSVYKVQKQGKNGKWENNKIIRIIIVNKQRRAIQYRHHFCLSRVN